MNAHDEPHDSRARRLFTRLLPVPLLIMAPLLIMGAAGAALAAAMPVTLAFEPAVAGAYDMAPVSLVAW